MLQIRHGVIWSECCLFLSMFYPTRNMCDTDTDTSVSEGPAPDNDDNSDDDDDDLWQ